MRFKEEVDKCKCERCGYIWIPRKEKQIVCPKCMSPYWDIPKKKKGKK